MSQDPIYAGIIPVNKFSKICSSRHFNIISDEGDGITTAGMSIPGDVSAYLTYTENEGKTNISYVSAFLLNKKTAELQQIEHVPAYHNNVIRLLKWVCDFNFRAKKLASESGSEDCKNA